MPGQVKNELIYRYAGLYRREELQKAAFHFENELLGVLGDDNLMGFDAYQGMSEQSLGKIIHTSVEQICRLSKDGSKG